LNNENHHHSTEEMHPHGNINSYVLGFILSIVLTLVAYFLVSQGILHGWPLNLAIVLLGIGQTWVQLRLFLHLGEEAWPKWNLLAFLFMALVVLIVVVGSLWIMSHLNERVMEMPDMILTPSKTTEGLTPLNATNL
jgi:cytochrome o ubiquinol oxidase subunit IV